MNIFTQFFLNSKTDPQASRDKIRQDFIRREATVGKHVFGPIPKGHKREFFKVDKYTWIWQETWKNNGNNITKTTKYIIREREIVKSVDGGGYERVSMAEAKNFERAVHTYVKRVKREVYGLTA